MPQTAKIFQSGNSQAVRLPKEFRFDVDEVEITREGDAVVPREMTVLDFTADDAVTAGAIRAELARLGTPIGPFDLLIAGQAKARGLCVVTNNTREFTRVAGLEVEDWTL